jgi:hypothetical protein
VPAPASRSPELLRRWESLPTGVQAGVSFAVFTLLMLFVNLSVFNQPLWRSILYGLIEGVPLTVLLLVATTNERRKRQQGRQDGSEGPDS